MDRRTKTTAVGLIPLAVLAAGLSLDHIPGTNISLAVPYAAEGPGPTVDTLGAIEGVDVVDVRGAETFETEGNLNMTTVSVRSNMTLVQAIGRAIATDDTIVPIEHVIPPGRTAEEVDKENQLEFEGSERAATVAALDYLERPTHVEVAAVVDDSPAAGALKESDRIVKVAGDDVDEPAEVGAAVRRLKPGDELDLVVERGGEEREVTVELGENPHDDGAAWLGILMGEASSEGIEVDYNLEQIGGPSAGMIFSLAVIDKLTEEELTGGSFVAGTGTIEADGSVGPIGGIEHKIAAAAAEGAELFLAPRLNCDEALDAPDEALERMRVVPVDTLSDAVEAIDAFNSGGEQETCAAKA